ncbi:MAG: N-acetyl-gamma-glutamyl-phosphate reductase [Opitutales bacterium]
MKVGIVGASGYSGELLLDLLSRHPRVSVATVTSRQHAGRRVSEVIPSLRGRMGDLTFSLSEPARVAREREVDLFFLALPHGIASGYAEALLSAGKKVIDLSADFRLDSAESYREYYGAEHPNPELLQKSSYVLPEVAGEAWKKFLLLASPGCYPTSVLLPLIPLLREKVLDGQGIVISSFSGVSGAGRKLAEDLLFCERAESAKAYGVPRHRHLSEMEEQLGGAAENPVILQFTPHLAPMRRGIISTTVVPAQDKGIDSLYECWHRTFETKPFVTVLPPGATPDSQHVVGTNRIDMSAVYDKRTGNFIITSALDNLMKGASGQAVQIMNLWCGFEETAGLL